MTADDYADLARLAEAAAGGEWTAKHRESLDWLSQERGDETHQPGSSVHNGDPGNPLFGTVWPHRNGAANAEFIAAANPATILRLIEDLRRTKSGARTLGRIIEQQNRDALDASGMHHVVDETGDGDWEVVWEALALLRPERDELAARLAAVEAALSNHPRVCDLYPDEGPFACGWKSAVADIEAALSAAPTDTTKETS